MESLSETEVDELRKLFRDILGPELRAIHTRIDAIEKLEDARYKALKSQLDRIEIYEVSSS